eukprot:TRINITY_DN2901_c0_g1_i1.p1 TRINITY_DN2901_c0_g1~~TRINITY_DN2901_c0_g1_i1.p1  ORF type:complete len:645 (-),score=115.97 TRINITY_DN2901_c0_g1_i1:114-1844(-)
MYENDEDTLLYVTREISVLRGARHPNIVQFIGVANDSANHFYVITEFVAGGDLRKRLSKKNVEIPWLTRVKVAYDAAAAMFYLHARDIIHRDLKAKNLLVDDQWKVKICDFGFARTQQAKTARPMTLCGTEEWMAPEILIGDPYTKSVDMFSFGIVLCEIITRKQIPKTLERSPAEAFGLNAERFIPLVPSDCPPDFAQLAIDCAAWDPEQRPEFKDVVKRLGILYKELGSQSPAPVKAKPAPVPVKEVKEIPQEQPKPSAPVVPVRTDVSRRNGSPSPVAAPLSPKEPVVSPGLSTSTNSPPTNNVSNRAGLSVSAGNNSVRSGTSIRATAPSPVVKEASPPQPTSPSYKAVGTSSPATSQVRETPSSPGRSATPVKQVSNSLSNSQNGSDAMARRSTTTASRPTRPYAAGSAATMRGPRVTETLNTISNASDRQRFSTVTKPNTGSIFSPKDNDLEQSHIKRRVTLFSPLKRSPRPMTLYGNEEGDESNSTREENTNSQRETVPAIPVNTGDQGSFTYEELLNRELLPPAIDHKNLPGYLSNEEFLKVFKMTREQFERIPKWQQVNEKKRLKLF